MAAQFLPPDHVIETVGFGSRFDGARDYTTHQLIAAGDTVVVCRRVAHPAVTSVEAWSETIETCYNCGTRNPGYGTPVPAPYAKKAVPPIAPQPFATSSSASTVVVRPDQLPGARRPQSNRLWPLLALLGAVAVMVVLGLLFVALGNGQATHTPATFPPPATEAVSGGAGLPTEPTRPSDTPPTAAPPTPISPTPAPPPTERARPTAIPQPTGTFRPPSPIRELVLIDASNDRALQTLADGNSISLSQLGVRYMTIQANVGTTPVGSIKFLLDGRDFCLNDRCVENSPPYSMAGDLGGDHYATWDWINLLGTHTITAIPYTVAGAAGEELPALTVQLTITR